MRSVKFTLQGTVSAPEEAHQTYNREVKTLKVENMIQTRVSNESAAWEERAIT